MTSELPACCVPAAGASEAEQAYCAYNVARGAGAFVPAWASLPAAEQAGWQAVVLAVRGSEAPARVDGLLTEERALLDYLAEYDGYRRVSKGLQDERLDTMEAAGWIERRATINTTKRSHMWRITATGREALRPSEDQARLGRLRRRRDAGLGSGQVIGRQVVFDRDREVQANVFAMHLLVPPSMLTARVNEDKGDLLDDTYLASLADRFQAPLAVVVLQLRNEGFFSAMEEE